MGLIIAEISDMSSIGLLITLSKDRMVKTSGVSKNFSFDSVFTGIPYLPSSCLYTFAEFLNFLRSMQKSPKVTSRAFPFSKIWYFS